MDDRPTGTRQTDCPLGTREVSMRTARATRTSGPVTGAVVILALLACPATAATLIGTAGDDTLTGTAAADEISGARGNDTISGLGGGDRIRGGPDDDVLSGGDGRDDLKGDAGSDRLFGELGEDRLRDGIGDDLLNGGPGQDLLLAFDGGADVLRGSFDDDELWVSGDDVAYGGPGFDQIQMLGGTNTAYGGDENDFIEAGGDQPQTAGSGGPAVSDLVGGPGDDTLELHHGLAVLRGGLGNDVLTAEGRPSTLPLFGGEGDDWLIAEQAYDPTPTPVHCGPGLDTVLLDLSDVPGDDCEESSYLIHGTDGDDVVVGTPYDDRVLPFTGQDAVVTGRDARGENRTRSRISSGGIGRAKRNPCPHSHPSSVSRECCSEVSIPSAIVRSPRVLESWMIARVTASSSGPVPSSAVNSRAILRMSTENCRR